jgi:DNA-binding LacI/PurR family transcriptional regulator
MEAARELGYKPNALARSLITRRSRMIGVAMAYLDNQFYPDVLEALARTLRERDLHILLFTAEKDRDADPGLAEILGHQVDALILASTTLSSALAAQCRAAGIPVILFNRTTGDGSGVSVTGDNHAGGHAIGRMLVADGHRHMAFIAGIENSSTSRDRERGFGDALTEAGSPPPVRAVGHYAFAGAAAAAHDLLTRADRPDAIFAANDHMAMAVMDVARHAFGLRIPQDLAVVGFDDVQAARWPSYDLTTYSQPIVPMVEATAKLLDDLLATPQSGPRHVVVPGQLVRRGSTHPRGRASGL